MTSLIKFSSKGWAALVTCLIIAVGYFYYFFVYVDHNQKLFDEKAYRVLNRIAENIQTNKSNFENNIKILKKEVELKLKRFTINNQERNDLTKAIESLNKKIESQQNELSSLLDQIEDNNVTEEISALGEETFKFSDSLRLLENKRDQLIASRLDKNEIIKNASGLYNLRVINEDDLKNNGGDIGYVLFKEKIKEDSILLGTSLEKFLEAVLEYNLFEEFILVRGSDQVAFQTFTNRIVVNLDSTAINSENDTRIGRPIKIISENITYQTYVHELSFGESENWTLIGCIEESLFVRTTRSIDSWWILYVGLFVLVVIVSMPVMKLAVMSNIERLHMNNVFFIGLSIVLGSPLVILSFLIIYNYYGFDQRMVDRQLNELSTAIEKNFKQELNSAYRQLDLYDTNLDMYRKQLTNKNIQDFNSRNSILLDTAAFRQDIFPYFNEVFWLDDRGQQIFQFTTSKESRALVNLSRRDYFKNVINDRFWIDPSWPEPKPFVLQSIISWISKENEVAISKSSDVTPNGAAVMITKLSSVMNPVLPLGFSFAFIDENGNVQLHSQSGKALQENFFKEGENNRLVKSAVIGHSPIYTDIKYHGKDYRSFVNAIDGLPLTLVVFYDQQLLKTKISQIWIFALFFVALSFLLSAVFIILLHVTRKSTNNLESHHFIFNWMKPRTGNKNLYKRLIISGLISAILVLVFSKNYRVEMIHELFRLSITPSLIFGLTYLNFHLTIEKYLPKKFMVFGIIILIIFNATHWFMFGFSIGNMLFQVLLIIVYWPAFSLKFFMDKVPVRGTHVTYYSMLLVWLITTSILPIYIYNNAAYLQESNTWAKIELLDHVKKLENRKVSLNKDLSKKSNGVYHPGQYKNDSLKEVRNKFGIYWQNIDSSLLKLETVPNSLLTTLIFYSRLNLRPSEGLFDGLSFYTTPDGYYKWLKNTDRQVHEIVALEYKPQIKNAAGISETYFANKKIGESSWHRFWQDFDASLLMVFLTFGFIIFLYALIRFAASRIYAINPIFESKAVINDHELLHKIMDNRNVLLLGPANSGRTGFIKRALEDHEHEYVNCIDLRDEEHCQEHMETEINSKKPIILIDNFEYEVFNDGIAQRKLRLLEHFSSKQKKIIVVSEIDPKEIFEYYKEQILLSDDHSTRKRHTDDLQVWRHIFSSFVRVFKPLEFVPVQSNIKNKVLSNIITSELSYGSYLPNLKPLIESKIELQHINEKNRDVAILEIEELAAPYYIALWNTLTKEERFVVYDLAKDGFVNIKNKLAILSLLKKGLLVYEDQIRLFNESFRNFILISNKNEALAMEKEMKKKGNWANIRNILILIVISLLVLISFGHPDFFEDASSIWLILTGLAGLVPTFNTLASFSQKIKPQ